MNEIISHLFEEKKSSENEVSPKDTKNYIYHYNFDIKYEILCPIIKDIQLETQLIKFFKNYQYSDLIFITGNSTSSINSRFFFNYRKMVDFYFQVTFFEEMDDSLKIVYHIYKTKPINANFDLALSLFKREKKAILEIEIIPPKNIIIPEKILNIIYNELDYNFLYLSLAVKLKKEKLIYYNSGIIQNEFFVLSQIIQNIKLIEYLINGKLTNITNKKKDIDGINSDGKNKNIQLNEVYKVNLYKQKEESSLDNISFKIINFKSREDKLMINIKIIYDNGIEGKNNLSSNSLYNIVTLNITKITNNLTFILIKTILDDDYKDRNINSIKKVSNKILSKLKKLSEISKNQISF